ncbi:hypothetical protein NSZ01_40800 [Nocardioides szechwanensis]|uniref:Uncharacterized protein n=1 Tax=Nocardioides szechwanensis TaxID=1005944 RepID=A0A1H0M4M3_9ACTN|nr:hypothetical protein [Nocardioides szechwanensis]GEP36312.1 hypothetical protein NSZ01_40800 [Nocardioides szechwanensis]SDO75080.1 hypothetical protein SAMN05192576_0380 [Nocardioides szechwanensis]
MKVPLKVPARLDGVARRMAAGTGLEEVLRLQRRVEDLEEAVAENTLLADPLAAQVTALEQALVGPLEHRTRLLRRRR